MGWYGDTKLRFFAPNVSTANEAKPLFYVDLHFGICYAKGLVNRSFQSVRKGCGMPHNLGSSPFHLTVALSVPNVVYKDFHLFYKMRKEGDRNIVYFDESAQKVAIEELQHFLDEEYLVQHCQGMIHPEAIIRFFRTNVIDV